MPDRLEELRRQRALVQEQLAWLDREIAAVDRAPAPSGVAAPASPPPAAAPAAEKKADAPAASVEAILSQYRSAPGAVRQDVRKGCLLYFALALAAFAVCVAILYFTIGPR